MKFLTFNIVVIAALGYLFVIEGKLPMTSDGGDMLATISKPNVPAPSPVHHENGSVTSSVSSAPAVSAPQAVTRPAPQVPMAPARAVAALTAAPVPDHVSSPAPRGPVGAAESRAQVYDTSIIPGPDNASPAAVQAAPELMTVRERRLELSRMAREMDLMALEMLSK